MMSNRFARKFIFLDSTGILHTYGRRTTRIRREHVTPAAVFAILATTMTTTSGTLYNQKISYHSSTEQREQSPSKDNDKEKTTNNNTTFFQWEDIKADWEQMLGKDSSKNKTTSVKSPSSSSATAACWSGFLDRFLGSEICADIKFACEHRGGTMRAKFYWVHRAPRTCRRRATARISSLTWTGWAPCS